MPAEYNDTIDYRLTNIEKALNELKDVMVDQKLLSRDQEDIRKDQEEIRRDVQNVAKAINAHEERIRVLEIAPTQAKAARWQQIVDMALKAVIAAALGAVLIKIGIKL